MPPEPTVYVVDDDDAVRDSVAILLESCGYRVRAFESGGAFLAAEIVPGAGCLLSDIRMPGLDGLQLQAALNERGLRLPVIFITGHGDVPVAVDAMKAGAVDFIEKPFQEAALLRSVERAIRLSQEVRHRDAEVEEILERVRHLTAREREVMARLAEGKQNKVIALDLGISPRTVEIHRARVMEKMGAANISDLVRAVLTAGVA